MAELTVGPEKLDEPGTYKGAERPEAVVPPPRRLDIVVQLSI
jgi:hypothetical protein